MIRRFLVLLLILGGIATAAGGAVLSIASSGNEPQQTANASITPVAQQLEQVRPTSTPPPTPQPDRTTCNDIRGTEYRSETEQNWFQSNCLAPPEPLVAAPQPPALPGAHLAGERWVLVDISSQTTTAMVGNVPFYTAQVTTGKKDWETPRGTFYIGFRVENETMTSAAIGAEEYYVLKDVLYTQYFTNSGHALHTNYWQPDSVFGNYASSHGCVGMRLADAEFFWRFARNGTRVTII